MTSYYPSRPSQSPPSTPIDLPASPLSGLLRPENYIADDGLVDAVNVALMLRQPLMVTGEPGTGKTMLASSIAWELGLDRPLVFETKSTSTAKDLFYTYDTLGRFTAKELSTKAGAPQDYVTFNALGEAIIRSSDPADLEEILPSAYSHPGPRRSVVLIDEVEKAPRDFPNDILNEIERMYFRIPELGNRRIDANPGYDPVVVMTNNSEKSLPDAFLRRCIFYNIPFPNGERLTEIVIARLPSDFDDDDRARLMRDVIAFVLQIRSDETDLEKKPGTSELLNYLSAMIKMGADATKSLFDRSQLSLAKRATPALVKIGEDQRKVAWLLTSWADERA